MNRGDRQKFNFILAVTLVLSMFFANVIWALPKMGVVVSGKSSITKPNSTTMNIKQTTDKSIINWYSYSIAENETVQYFQPSSISISLNRVIGIDPSKLYGKLSANGQVWVINPNGLLIGKNAKINVGGFLGSTLNIDNSDFLKGKYKFYGSRLPSITNNGTIKAKDGGYVVLISPSITNAGNITANMGEAYLASGNQVTLNFSGNDLIGFTVDKKTAAKALGIKNTGKIIADGGEVILSAEVASDVMKTVINNEGIIRARTIENKEGTIKLLGGKENNAVYVSGTLDASAPSGGNGGFIETSAAKVKVSDVAKITTYAPEGSYGLWLIDPNDYNVAAVNGDISGAALSFALEASNVELQSSGGTNPGSGNVNINDDVSWSSDAALILTASNNVNINSNITATGDWAVLMINPNTDNGGEAATGTGTLNLNNGAVITLSGLNPGFYLNYVFYTVINEANGGVTALQNMSTDLTGHYVLGTDIDASATSTWNSDGSGGYYGFAPVGNDSTQFTGSFNGLGHTISNLYINRPSEYHIGLFGYAGTGSAISNVGLVGGSVTGNGFVGGITGQNDGTINNIYATGDVTGGYNVGGLAGYNKGSISDSYAAGNVNGIDSYSNIVGGLAGQNDGTIINSYATGNVNGLGDSVGGLAGYNYDSGSISNSYFGGSVSGTSNVGSLVGLNGGTVTNSHYDIDTVLINGASHVTLGGLYDAQYTDWINHGKTLNIADYASSLNPNGGYYEISTAQGLKDVLGFADVSGYKFRLTADLNLADIKDSTGAISDWYIPYFSGSEFDGSGHVLSNLNVNQSFGSNIGFIGINSSGGTLKNIGLTDVSVTGGGYIGGLVGHNNGGLISNSYSSGSVTGANFSGGLVGYNYCGSIDNSYATGSVTGSTGGYIGGLVGYSSGGSSSITDSYSSASVNGRSYVGGLVGDNEGTISDSSATGPVICSNITAGGLVGWNYSGGSISNSYATGSVSASGGSSYYSFGGLAGKNSGTISYSSATGSVNGQYYVGGLAGENEGTINYSHATGSVSGNNYVGGLVGLSCINGTCNSSGTIISDSYATGDVTGSSAYIGGLIGRNQNCNISNVYATGNVTGASGSSYIGGLVGENYCITGTGCSAISNAYATGNVYAYGNYVGGLSGVNTNASISNSYATGNVYAYGSVTGSTSYVVGGLVGYNTSRGSISNSYATGNIYAYGNVANGGYYVGGLVGYNYNSASSGSTSISSSYAYGNVTGSGNVTGTGGYYVGGVVGYNYSSSTGTASITNAYAIGNVTGSGNVTSTGSYYIGGLAGRNGSGNSSITNTYASGNVTRSGSGSYLIGGLIAKNGGTVSNSFWDMSTSNQTASDGGTGKSTADMMTASSYSGWTDFNTNWYMIDGYTRPFLRMEYSTNITNAHQLQLIALAPTASYTLASNIDLSSALTTASGMWNTTYGFVPIGDSATPFSGTFNGQGHTITGLTVTRTSSDYVGLFGYTGSGSTVSNVGLVGGSISGANYVGGLAGYNGGTISNASSTATVSGSSFVGGLVGENKGTISSSYASGAVTGTLEVGGLVGWNYDGTISNSHATGNVTGTGDVGGLIGCNYYSGTGANVTVYSVYATGNVSGNWTIGGLVGFNYGNISDAYATGSVRGSHDVGGLVGNNYRTITNTYATGSVSGITHVGGLAGNNGGTVVAGLWDTDTSGTTTGIGGGTTSGATGKTTAQMKTAATYTGAGWSSSIWNMTDGSYASLK